MGICFPGGSGPEVMERPKCFGDKGCLQPLSVSGVDLLFLQTLEQSQEGDAGREEEGS